jgi:hypothetical protein
MAIERLATRPSTRWFTQQRRGVKMTPITVPIASAGARHTATTARTPAPAAIDCHAPVDSPADAMAALARYRGRSRRYDGEVVDGITRPQVVALMIVESSTRGNVTESCVAV